MTTETCPVDWQECLRINNNRADVAEELLQMFKLELASNQQAIEQAMQQQDWSAMASYVHKLHGACCYCGVPKLRMLAAHLEETLKTTHTAAKQDVDTLLQEMKSVQQALETNNYRDKS